MFSLGLLLSPQRMLHADTSPEESIRVVGLDCSRQRLYEGRQGQTRKLRNRPYTAYIAAIKNVAEVGQRQVLCLKSQIGVSCGDCGPYGCWRVCDMNRETARNCGAGCSAALDVWFDMTYVMDKRI